MKNIVLMGFMGCGKTTIGKYVSRTLGSNFIDTDEIIANKEKMEIADIFKRYGEDYFREREKDAIKYAAKHSDAVISIGGGAGMFDENIKSLKENGVVYYIDVSFDEAYKRISGDNTRPIAAANDREGLLTLYRKRAPAYERACSYRIVCTDDYTVSFKDIGDKIIELHNANEGITPKEGK